ncbi:MAG: glycosyltransferase [Bdellovibrionota bacterium]
MHEIAITFQILIWIVFGIGMAVQFLGLGGLVWFRRKTPPKFDPALREFPGVTMIKACHGTGDNEEVNFDTYFHQDYPGPFELLFVVSYDDAPVVPIIQRYLEKYPDVDAKMLVSRTRRAFWRKTDAIYDGMKVAKHDFIVLTDSDTIVQKNYVSQMSACLMDPTVGVVTTPQYDCRPNNVASALKVVGNNADVATFVMAYLVLVRNRWCIDGFGQSMAFRKSEFDSFGERAWTDLNQTVSDDQGIPYIYRQHGMRMVFVDIFCPVEYSSKTFTEVVTQKTRWLTAQGIAVGNRYLHSAGALLYPTVSSMLMMLWTGFCGWSILMFLGTCAFRILCSVLFENLFLRSEPTLAPYFFLVPVWDLMQPYFLTVAFFKDAVEYNGRHFQVYNEIFLREVDPDMQEILEKR